MLIIIRFISIFTLLFFSFTVYCSAISEPSLSAQSAIIIDGETNEVIYAKNAHSVRSMASTTKIMTTLIAVESGKLDELIEIDNPPLIEGTAIGFSSGNKVTLETLCYGMLLESGNDAALLTAEFLSGNEEEFSKSMNAKARQIGMYHTNFVTASGLDDEMHYTTAYDMALLGAYAVKNEKFSEICSSTTYKATFQTPDQTRTFYNHNRLLNSCEGVFGIKTGFTKKSGRCLVTACRRNGKTLVAVTLSAPDDWNDHKKMYSYGYSLYREVNPEIRLKNILPVCGAERDEVKISCDIKPFSVSCNSKITYRILLPENIYAPIKKNDVVGKIEFFSDDNLIFSFPILADENVHIYPDAKIYKPGFFEIFTDYIKNLFKNERK